MLDLVDAVALSLGFPASRRRVAEALRIWFPPRKANTAAPAFPPLEFLLSWICRTPDGDTRAKELRGAAEQAIESARGTGIEPLGWGDDRYPWLVSEIPDPPAVLWVRGQIAALSQPAVAIVGSRAASPYGLEAAERLAGGLARYGLTVVSGLARGVDSAAHRGALAGGGRTVAVLGSGADVIYPPEHRTLFHEIVRDGALVTELAPGTPPKAFHFPQRNRIISGLSIAVVVVEAAERSGSLITAECALDQGREVMALPGSVLNGRNGGSHRLLKDGAMLVESADDVVAALPRHLIGAASPAQPPPSSLSDPLLDGMADGESYDLDELCGSSGQTPAALLPRLLELELKGALRRTEGGRFMRSRRNVLT